MGMLPILYQFVVDFFVYIALAMFFLALLLESSIPATNLNESIRSRWWRNFGLGCIDHLANRGVGTLLVVAVAEDTFASQVGLLEVLDLPNAIAFIVGFLLLDLKGWLFHWLNHHIGILWRVHQVHHCDSNLDLTTGFRFHPIESVLNGLITLAVVLLLGVPAEVIVVRAVTLYGVNFVVHANMILPPRLDHALNLLLVTPAMHRIHHAPDPIDANSNYGVIFSFWDRIFGTYRKENSRNSLEVGLDSMPNAHALTLWQLIVLPFRAKRQSEQTTG